MVGQAIQQGGRHLGVAEDGCPIGEDEIGGDDDCRPLVEAADQVEEQLAAAVGKGQIAQLVEDDEVDPGKLLGQPASVPGADLGLELVDPCPRR